MTDAWDDIKALKNKRNNLREKLEKRKKERHGILTSSSSPSIKQEENEDDTKNVSLVGRKSENGKKQINLSNVEITLRTIFP